MMKKLVLLGSTGSIGTQTLDVIDHLDGQWEVAGLSANTSIDLLEKQANKYLPDYVVIMNDKLAKELEYRLENIKTEVLSGEKGLIYLAGELESDIVINALVGAAGLKPTMAALRAGRQLGLANKESMVIGGEIIYKYLMRKNNSVPHILPIDSEHNAIFQLLSGHNHDDVRNILLTASGGPFRNHSVQQIEKVTVEQALNHPNWDMGGKITIDSATLMNKGLEVIEAHWLFKQPYDKIKVVIHPESIIHSMVETIDGSILAELGVADMRIPIQFVLTYPERKQGKSKYLNLYEIGQLNFQQPDFDKFPALKLAYEAGKMGGTMPVVLNGANEVAVASFMKNKLSFTDIPVIIDRVMNLHNNILDPDLEDIYQIDRWTRSRTREVINDVVNYH